MTSGGFCAQNNFHDNNNKFSVMMMAKYHWFITIITLFVIIGIVTSINAGSNPIVMFMLLALNVGYNYALFGGAYRLERDSIKSAAFQSQQYI